MRKKVLAVVVVTTLAALLVSIVSIIAYDLRSYHRRLVVDISTQADLLGHMTAAALAFDDARLARENLSLLRLRPGVRAAAIYDAQGKLFASYRAPDTEEGVPEHAGLDGARVHGIERMEMFQSILERGDRLGTVYLSVDFALLSRVVDYLGIGLFATLLALGCAVLVARKLDRVITGPVLAVSEVAREVVETRDYSRRAPRTSADEAAQLADAFNAMLSEIEQRTRALETSNREIAREAEQRAQAQQEVMRLNAGLEQRVHERTMQLELANAELELAMAEARKANQAKSAFLSAMSHELRTPLNAILGFAQLLGSDSLPSTPEQKKEFADHILKSGRHLLTLINEILDLAKVESGQVALSMEPVALGEVLTEVRAMVEPLAARRAVRVLFPSSCTLMLKADRTRLRQVLLNLLSNAIKYNREQGAVVVAVQDAEGGRMRITVQDTGQGLTPEQVARLFEPFNRLGQESGAEEGTGIGLVVTKRLVELMNGKIGVTSTPGVGSVFWFELGLAEPAHPGLPELTEAPLPAPRPGAAHTVLYVEDNPANLRLVEEIMRLRPDIELLTATDAHAGIRVARARLPDLILMDLNLPGMSGTDAFRELRASPRTAGIPVIAVTANAMPSDIESGKALGFFRYLTKPINVDEFTAALDAALGAAGAAP
ncbi:MAG TPA: ATP-binding protein [Telluria sp.]|nr:ATP-binding protein [Telluria sp.]